jgi:hypothetical protein
MNRGMLLCYNLLVKRTWRNWYTRSLEEAVPQGMEVQVLSSAPDIITYGIHEVIVAVCDSTVCLLLIACIIFFSF